MPASPFSFRHRLPGQLVPQSKPVPARTVGRDGNFAVVLLQDFLNILQLHPFNRHRTWIFRGILVLPFTGPCFYDITGSAGFTQVY